MFAPLLEKTKNRDPASPASNLAAQHSAFVSPLQREGGVEQVSVQLLSRVPCNPIGKGREFSKIAMHAPDVRSRLPFFQAKLKIGAVDDPFEQEADRVAHEIVRMRGPMSAGNPNPAGHDVVQRTCTACDQAQGDNPDDKEALRGEQILMQAKRASTQLAQPDSELESATRSLEGGGDPLPSSVRQYMEPRFGHDFGNVRVHADSRAAEMAKLANARAFTVGRNIVFASGEYGSNGPEHSSRLLAHELTHVIQQGRAGPRLQRQIVVGDKPYTPSLEYRVYLAATYGPAMREFVENMDNEGDPPIYSFSTYEQMATEVRIRANAIKGIEEVHKGCCDYYNNDDPPHLDSEYWDQVNGQVDFKMKSPLPTGKQPSDAIEAIFAPGAGTRLECLTMALAIQYYAMLRGLGADKFNENFAGGIEIAKTGRQPLFQGPRKKYEVITVASKDQLLPGDWVYFQNFKDYRVKNPTGFWQGENSIYLGGGLYRGFGVDSLSEDEMNGKLVENYDVGASPPKHTVKDLIADGGGVQLNQVSRPIIAKLTP